MAEASEQQITERYGELIEAVIRDRNGSPYEPYSLTKSASGKAITKLSREEQAELAIAMLRWDQSDHQNARQDWSSHETCIIDTLIRLLKRKLPFTESDVLELLAAYQQDRRSRAVGAWWSGGSQIVKLVQNYLDEHPLTSELQESIQQTYEWMESAWGDQRKYGTKLRQLIASNCQTLMILPGEAWADQAIQQIEALPEAARLSWLYLIEACSLVSGGKPTKKWLKQAQPHREAVGLETFTQWLGQWFPLVDRPRTQPLPDWRGSEDYLNDKNADILKGLVWLCADLANAELARSLSQLAMSAYRKIPGTGPRCVKLGNACIWALGQMPTQAAIAQLALLKVKVKFGTAQQGIEKALTAAAERQGLPRAEIEELAVPTYGLTDVGLRRDTLGDFTAELSVTGTSSTSLRWIKPDGKPQKSVPKAVKENQADELKALKQDAKDIQKMLPAQRDRIESLYLQRKTWDFATWQERYLHHPLVGTLARRLLWQFEAGDGEAANHAVGIWLDGQLVNLDSQPIDWLTDTTKVSLWHPITAAASTIQAWRNWLIEHQIQQPFKQAHRELYLLTAAEETTRVYSNRYAAHILKQHQFNALCSHRGWKNQLRLMVDDDYNPATLWLPQWGLRAEFWIEGIGEDYGTDTNETGTYLYLSTDQVRFYANDANQNFAHAGGGGYYSVRYQLDDGDIAPVPLEEIPALVFTEVMRDVDLFVGVASVGNDPNWSDGGPEGRHYDYWQSYSFGELSATAQTRRQVLGTLVPKLKIGDRCSFQDRFLVVRGEIRTYKIHLGSGNILMEPNDQYLCIVQGQTQGKASTVFLPFEGDRTMAIILSKALLLANDTAITDPTILSQIGHKPM